MSTRKNSKWTIDELPSGVGAVEDSVQQHVAAGGEVLGLGVLDLVG